MKHLIAVIGGRKASAQHKTWAYEVGKALAGRGAVVLCGGMVGVMTAAARGVRIAQDPATAIALLFKLLQQ